MRATFALLAATACGRVDFDSRSDGTAVVPGDVRSTLTVMQPPAAALTDFPLLVVLDDTRAARDLMASNASDLRFYDSSGAVLAHEIEQLGQPGGAPLIAWVRVPVLDAGTQLSVEYGHAPRATSTQSVWSGTYAGVWHMNGLRDATDHTHDAALLPTTAIPARVPAKIGDGLQLAATSSNAMTIADAADLAFTSAITASGWMNISTFATTSGYTAIITREQTGTNNDLWLGVKTNHPTSAVFTGTLTEIDSTANIATNTWAQLAFTYDGAVERVYLDGMQVGQQAIAGTATHTAHPVLIGADCNAGGAPDADFATGILDEIRLETVARDAAWLAFDNLAQRDAVLQYGPVSR